MHSLVTMASYNNVDELRAALRAMTNFNRSNFAHCVKEATIKDFTPFRPSTAAKALIVLQEIRFIDKCKFCHCGKEFQLCEEKRSSRAVVLDETDGWAPNFWWRQRGSDGCGDCFNKKVSVAENSMVEGIENKNIRVHIE